MTQYKSGYLHAKNRMGEGQIRFGPCPLWALPALGPDSRHERDSGVNPGLKQTAKKNKELFKKECELFANAGVLIGEIVLPDKDKELRDWKMRKDNLDLWIEQEIAKKVEECKQAGL